MKEFNLQDTLRVSDSKIKGFVVMQDQEGKTIFAKSNMIVEDGRSFIMDLVYNQVATTTILDRKFTVIKFGSGNSTTTYDMTDLVTEEATITEIDINITDLVWSEYIGSLDLDGLEDYDNTTKYYDTDTLYTLKGPGIWDDGTVVTDTATPPASPVVGDRYFNSLAPGTGNGTLYTCITDNTWTGAETVPLAIISFAEDDIYLNSNNSKYYTYTLVLTEIPATVGLGLRITIDVTGSGAITDAITELGLFTNDAITEELFSRVVFDAIPLTENFSYKLTYYIYF